MFIPPYVNSLILVCTFINFEKKFPLHSLILVCTFIEFEKIFPPASLFCPVQQSYFGLHIN